MYLLGSAANILKNLHLSWSHFYDGREGRQPSITCTASYTLVIKRSSVLKKNILRKTEAVTRMCFIKGCL